MTSKPSLTVGLCCVTWLAMACGGDAASPPAPPPPLPERPALAVPTEPVPEAPAPSEPVPVEPAGSPEVTEPGTPKKEPKRGASLYDLEPERKQGKTTGPQPSAKVDPPAPAPKPAPAPAPAPKPVANKPFNMPGSAHVRIDAPAGLLTDLAKDSRMQPWLSQGVAAATKCYEREAKTAPGLSGTIVVSIVMHENDRPDASLQTLPSQLSGMFACLTGSMMKSRMPLFTGKEGQKYTARVTFAP